MVTFKEYEIYLKVKMFIETIDCRENYMIPKLINGVGFIPAYIPLIIESDDMEPTKYHSLSAAERGCGILKQTIVYAYTEIGAREYLGEKVDLRCLGLSGWISFIYGEIN